MLTVSCAKSSPIAGPRECVKHNDNKAESFMGLFGKFFNVRTRVMLTKNQVIEFAEAFLG